MQQSDSIVFGSHKENTMRHTRDSKDSNNAFTLLELLVVIAIIAVLAGLLSSALGAAKARGQSAACLNNKKQLQLAWLLYENDHDKMPPNGHEAPYEPDADLRFWWAQGQLDYDRRNSQNTNTQLLLSSRYARLGRYSGGAAAIYRCPADRSKIVDHGKSHPRARSVSMNAYLGGLRNCLSIYVEPVGPQKVSELQDPSQTFAFIDQHQDSLGFIQFWVDQSPIEHARFMSYPGAYHNGAATLSFVDGHVENRRWIDDRTLIPTKGEKNHSWPPADEPSPGNVDVQWLQQRSAFPKESEG